MAVTILDENLGEWLNVAYIITSIAMMAHFGQKHKDRNLILAFVFSCTLWFLFMVAVNLDTLDKLLNNCKYDDNGFPDPSDPSTCHVTDQEYEEIELFCKESPECDESTVKSDLRHPIAEVLPDCVITILLALGALHAANFAYRDLKPENILLDSAGHVRLSDFGLAKAGVSALNTGASTFCGTPSYMAPEVLLGTGHGLAVDWWSFGALIHPLHAARAAWS